MSLQSEQPICIFLSFTPTLNSLNLDKHFLNTPSSLVIDSLEGLCAVNPRLALDVQNKSKFTNNNTRTMITNVR